jgi:penicillin-binding protein 1C
MNWLHRNEVSAPKVPPVGVVPKKIDLSLRGSPRVEWFIEGTEPNLMKPRIQEANHRILYPVSGTVIAQDPDIPAEQQRLFFQAQPPDPKLRWVLDGKGIGSAGSLQLWSPQPGKHALSLLDEKNHVVDSVNFHVRGASID